MDRVLIATRSYANFQKYPFGDELARPICHINPELDEDVMLDCGKVSSESTVELIFYDQNGDETDKQPVGALWLPFIDILNYNINDSGNPQHTSTKIDSWLTPAGRVHLIIDFGKTPWNNEHQIRLLTHPISAELSEVNSQPYPLHNDQPYPLHNDQSPAGHNFVIKKFPHQMRCAVCHKSCDAFSRVRQCTTCKLLCHIVCSLNPRHFMPPCLDTDYSSMEEAKRQHRLLLNSGEFEVYRVYRHQWVPYFNLSTNWCCHCGYLLSLGEGNQEGANRRCEECNNTCHAQCQALIPNRCGRDPGVETRGFAMINPIRQFPNVQRQKELASMRATRPELVDGTSINPAPKML
jgi:hypothetical protein